jgi:hypothetical protein
MLSEIYPVIPPIYLGYYEPGMIIIVLVYSILPTALSTKKHFEVIGFENSVIEFEFLKKLMYVSLPLLIIIMLIFLRLYVPENPNFSSVLFPGFTLIAGSTLLRIFSYVSKKDFRFYYTRGCYTKALLGSILKAAL